MKECIERDGLLDYIEQAIADCRQDDDDEAEGAFLEMRWQVEHWPKAETKAHWIFSIQCKDELSYRVIARCSECGQRFYGIHEPYLPQYAYNEVSVYNTEEECKQHIRNRAEVYLSDSNVLDNYCRNCGAKLSLRKKDEFYAPFDWVEYKGDDRHD